MFMRIFIIAIIMISVAVGVFALVLPRDQLVKLILFRDFFDVTLPILAFGALVKYLCTCCLRCKTCHIERVERVARLDKPSLPL